MYHRVRRKMKYLLIYIVLSLSHTVLSKASNITVNPLTKQSDEDNFDNNIIDFDEDYSIKYNKKYGTVPYHASNGFQKETHKYIVDKDDLSTTHKTVEKNKDGSLNIAINETKRKLVEETTELNDYSVIPVELISTTHNHLISILESTTEPDLTVIPLSTTNKVITDIEINQTVTLPSSTQSTETTTGISTSTENEYKTTTFTVSYETTSSRHDITTGISENVTETTTSYPMTTENILISNETKLSIAEIQERNVSENQYTTEFHENITEINSNKTKLGELLKTNSSKQIEMVQRADFSSSESQEDVPIFTELDAEEFDVPEDYYDAKDTVPTTAPKTDALSVIFGLAGSVVESVVESVAERVVPKGIFDLFKRMQKQSEALEAERLRSREENGGLGQFGRGILKSISSGLSKPLSQLMAGAKDIGSLDTDRGFVSSVASGVSSVASVATSVVDAFKDRVQAIYPGTVWCGDGHSATARSSDLGLFFFTDTCCRQHDACKIYIKSGETKYGLTNTGLFTRSHCSCDLKFRDCLRKTNSLVSAQIGLTYFNVLGPQCFRRSHPIVKCIRRTRITGQKCEEYELDYTKPKMWQWFDNETF